MGEEVGHPRPFLGQGIDCEDLHLVYFVLFSSPLAFFSHGFFLLLLNTGEKSIHQLVAIE